MGEPTDEEVLRAAVALEENCSECNWMSRRQIANIARTVISEMRAIEREREDARKRLFAKRAHNIPTGQPWPGGFGGT